MSGLDSLVVRTTCHFEPVQLLFDLMKRVVADLVVGAHGEHRLPHRLDGSAMEFAVCGASRITRVRIPSFVRQVCRELLPDGVGDRRFVMREAGKSRTQCAFTRRTQFAADRIVRSCTAERKRRGLALLRGSPEGLRYGCETRALVRPWLPARDCGVPL